MKYTEPGTYELTYTAIDSCGNESTATRVITVERALEEIALIPPHTATLMSSNIYSIELAEPITLYNGDVLIISIDGSQPEPVIFNEASGHMVGDGSLLSIALRGMQGEPLSAGELRYHQSTGAETIDFRLYRG